MRACSRCVVGEALSDCFGGSGRLTCVVAMRPGSAHPARSASSAKAAGPASRRTADIGPFARVTLVTNSAPSVAPDDLDLLGPRRLHPGAAPLLNPPADPHAQALQSFRFEARRRKAALVALGDGHREVLRPAAPEVDVDRAAALAHG